MRLTVAALTILVLLSGTAQAKEPKELFKEAENLFAMERYESAIDAYELVLREFGLETDFAPKCFERIALSLFHLDQPQRALEVLRKGMEEFEGREEVVDHLGKLARHLDGEVRNRTEPAEKQRIRDEYERRQAEAERALERAQKARDIAEQLRDHQRKIEEMRRMWEEHGVPNEEIEERLALIRKRYEQVKANLETVREVERQLKERGVPPEEARREIEARVRRIHEEMEAEWRRGREDDLEGVRREFIHLAERLGIPPEEAERFLKEHTRRSRRDNFFSPEAPNPRPDQPFDRPFHGPGTRGDETERREQSQERLVRALEKLASRLERLEERLEKIEARERR